MKITTSILAALIIFLSTQCVYMHETAATGMPVAKKTCCAKKQSCKKEAGKKKDDGCKEACNPFMACGGCSFILPERPVLSAVNSSDLSVKTGFKKDFFNSNYNADCWHPPENCLV
ncbi:MAG: hypothetical protein ABI741_11785 [Ferruginibacter sp.]